MNWNILKTNPLLACTYSKKLNVGTLLSKVLINRNINLEDANDILNCPDKLFEDPNLIYGADNVAQEIINNINSNNDIYIFADYDVDGLTSGYVMTDFLRSICNNKIEIYYPNRSEGYGLSIDFCQKLIDHYKNKQNNVTVITVDNGITKIEEVKLLKQNNINVIITDHHEPSNILPETIICDAFINKNSNGKHLCGAAIAWKICYLIAEKLNKLNLIEHYLPYIALATVADVMPITKENMAIISKGLKILNDKNYSSSLKFLANKLGLKTITSKDLAWNIAPKINSCSRMDRLDIAEALFFFDDMIKDKYNDVTIDDICLYIIELDEQRKSLVKKAIKEADSVNYNNDKVCIFDSSKYNSGIAGIIAGKLTEKYNKPAIVVTKDKDGMYKGSVRSVSGLNMYELLLKEKESNNIIDCGGHAEAAGLSFKENQINNLKSSLNLTIDDSIVEIEDSIDIDSCINLIDINNNNLYEINSIPYDKNNFKSPIFCLRMLDVIKTKTSSNNSNNICFTFKDRNNVVRNYWGWGIGEMYTNIGSPKQVDVIGRLDYGFGNNANKATFIIIDIKKGENNVRIRN